MAFRERPHVPGEPQPCGRVEGRGVEALSVEPRQIRIVEREFREQPEDLLEAGRDEESAPGRELANRLEVTGWVIPRRK